MTDPLKPEALTPAALEALERRLAGEHERRQIRKSMAAWARYKGFEPAAHHRLIIDELERFIFGDEYDILLLHCPPGSAKSTYISHLLPAWYMASFPQNSVLFATHSADFAQRWGRRVRAEIANEADVLGISVSPDNAAADQFSIQQGGEYRAVGAGAGISGFRADLGVCDDLFGSREDAWSATVREKRWDWFLSDFSPRLKPKAKRISISTRWHESDIAGRIIEQIDAGHIRGRVVDIPAVAGADDPVGRSEGEYLWGDQPDYDYPSFLRDRQREISPMSWAALFQQKPAPEDGDYFKAEWIQTYDIGPARETMRVYGGSDFALSADKGDWTVHAVVGLDPHGRMHLLDLWRKQATSDASVEALCDLFLKWKPLEWGHEKGQITSALGPYLTQRQRERRAYCVQTSFPTRGDKAVRAQSFRAYIERHGLHVQRDAPWFATMRAEMLSFPAGKHDDICDALGLCGQLLDKMLRGMPLRPLAPPTVKDRWNKVFGEDTSKVNWKTQ